MPKAAVFRHPEPMSAINVTPFIDVLLVLLIMLIITVPMVSHKVPIDLPNGPADPIPKAEPYRLAIDAGGRLFWEGRPIADAELPSLLHGMQASNPEAALTLSTDPETRYERFDSVLATVKRANVTRLGFVGNEHMKL